MSDRGRTRTILCPVDFSDHTLITLAEAVAQTEKFGGELLIVHVLNEKIFDHLDRIDGRYGTVDGVNLMDQAMKNLGDEREAQLLALLQRAEVNRVPHRNMIIRGYPYEVIINLAREQKTDLIVMGAKGRDSMVRQLRFGNTAEKVFRRAECNVLFVR